MTIKIPILSKARKALTRSFTAYDKDNAGHVIAELQQALRDTIQAVTELQQLQIASRDPDIDGTPKHLARCELFDGQYLRIPQTAAAGQIVTVAHGLARKPQGAIFIQSGLDNNLPLISGSIANNIPPADAQNVAFVLNGAAGNMHICILF